LPSFFFCASCLKRKSVTKANYLLIPRLFSRFSFAEQAERKANKRNADCARAAQALLRAGRSLLQKRRKTIAWCSANNVRNRSTNQNLKHSEKQNPRGFPRGF
jgi:hypothetical protein